MLIDKQSCESAFPIDPNTEYPAYTFVCSLDSAITHWQHFSNQGQA